MLGLAAVLSAVLVVVQADLLARVLADGVLGRADAGAVGGLLAALGVVFAARAAAGWWRETAARRGAAAVKRSLRRQVLERTQELGPGWLAGQRTGGIATTLGRGLDALDAYFVGYLPQLFVAAVVPVAVLVRLITADLASAVIVGVTLPLIPVFGVLVGMQTKSATRRQWRALERLGGRFLDIVAGLPTLRAFGRAEAQAAMVRGAAEEHRTATMRTLRVAFVSALVLELVATLSVALVAVPVGLRLLDGALDLHTALLVLLLAPEAYLPLRALGSQFHASTEGLEVAERCFAVLDVGDGISDRSAASALVGLGGEACPDPRLDADSARRSEIPSSALLAPHRSAPAGAPSTGLERRESVNSGAGDHVRGLPVVELEGVTVRYSGRGEAALDDVSFTVAAGERVALVGPSGAGKSTLLGVVLGLVGPDDGRVLVDGVDLVETGIDAWRSRLAWVPQRPHLFARSVADNIRLGFPDATDDEVRRAAEQAHADEFVAALPQGYDTLLGERGFGLSAGQRQRIALARAFLRDADVVVLDEPTAGLDLRSEAEVVEATRRLTAGRTVLVVAHRPAMLADADRVVRLDHGRIEAAASASATGVSAGATL